MRNKKLLKLVLIEVVAIFLLTTCYSDFSLIMKGFLYLQILIYASVVDIEKKIIPDRVHLLILIISLISINIKSSILGLLIALFINTIPPKIFKLDMLGGGDIKMMCASGFFLGSLGSIVSIYIGLFISILFNLDKFKKENIKVGFALAPYLSIGCFFTYLIGGFF